MGLAWPRTWTLKLKSYLNLIPFNQNVNSSMSLPATTLDIQQVQSHHSTFTKSLYTVPIFSKTTLPRNRSQTRALMFMTMRLQRSMPIINKCTRSTGWTCVGRYTWPMGISMSAMVYGERGGKRKRKPSTAGLFCDQRVSALTAPQSRKKRQNGDWKQQRRGILHGEGTHEEWKGSGLSFLGRLKIGGPRASNQIKRKAGKFQNVLCQHGAQPQGPITPKLRGLLNIICLKLACK